MKSGPPTRLGSKNLILFRASGHDYKIPRLEGNDQEFSEGLEANLSPEEKSFICHYLRYGDALLKQSSEEGAPVSERRKSNVVEIGREYDMPAQNGGDEEDGCARFNAA